MFPIRFTIILLYIFIFASISLFAQTSLKINEILASNLTVNADENGDYDDWIEIYNPTESDIDLAGYYLSDDFSDLNKSKIPAGFPELTTVPGFGYLLLWADDQPWDGATHLGFKLSASGEQLALVEKDGTTVIDSLTYQPQNTNISFGRYPDAGNDWFYYDQPTPAGTNTTGYLGLTTMPDFWEPPGFYPIGLSVTLKNNDLNSTMYYTLDGSNPDLNSNTYEGSIDLNGSSVVRIRSFKDNYIPSKINSNAYFLNETFNLPIMVFITDPANLFDQIIGIYTNYNKYGFEWERDVHVQYFKESNEFSIPAGIRIQGSTSRFMAKKSFRLFFKNGYGPERLEYDMFDNPQVATFKNLILRAGYDDDLTMPEGTLLRDPLVSEIWNEMGELSSLSNFAILQINNDYWGIYNIRESINEYFIQDHLGITDFDLMRFEKSSAYLKYGSRTEWDNFWNFVESADFTQASDYAELKQRINLDNYLTLQGLVQCSEYRSYLWGCLIYRESRPDAQWNFTIWDMDRAYTNVYWDGFAAYNLTNNENWANLLIKKLLLNQEFKNLFINRVADYLNSYFTPEHAIATLDSLVNIIEPEIPNEVDRWNTTLSKWQNNVEGLRFFARNRPQIVRDQILMHFGVEDTVRLTLKSDTQQGYLKVNSITVKQSPWSGIYFKNIPVPVKAVPKIGYKFVKWIPDTYSAGEDSISVNLTEPQQIEAVFEPDLLSGIVINEINYNSSPDFDPGDWIELHNTRSYELDISGCKFQDENSSGNVFIIPPGTTIQAKGYLVLCADNSQFHPAFPDVTNYLGNFGGDSGFGLSGSGERIRFMDKNNTILDEVTYDDKAPWPTEPDEEGYTLELNAPDLDNTLPASWSASNAIGGTPGAKNSVYTAIEKSEIQPVTLELNQNYPNPFNPKTVISYRLPASMVIDLSIYNILGQKVATLISQRQPAGTYKIEWDATDFSSGIYFYKLRSCNIHLFKKMAYLK
jgi:hypothetical protein